MIEDNKTVKSIEAKVGGKSGTYWTVTWTDGKTDNIFNGDWLPLLEQSQNENRPLHFTKEKSRLRDGSEGKYYNIKSLELVVKLATPAPHGAEYHKPPDRDDTPPPPQTKPEIAPQEKGMWWKEVGENFRAGLFKRDDNKDGAYLWKTYIKQMLSSLEIIIPKKEVPLEKSKLVETAKKLGVIEKGEKTTE